MQKAFCAYKNNSNFQLQFNLKHHELSLQTRTILKVTTDALLYTELFLSHAVYLAAQNYLLFRKVMRATAETRHATCMMRIHIRMLLCVVVIDTMTSDLTIGMLLECKLKLDEWKICVWTHELNIQWVLYLQQQIQNSLENGISKEFFAKSKTKSPCSNNT